MDENFLDNTEQCEENGVSDTEFVDTDTEYSKDAMEYDADSTDSNGDIPTLDETSSDLESENANALRVNEETSISESTNEGVMQSIGTYYNSELGGYPVVIMNDMSDEYGTSITADYEDYYTTLSTTWESYFSGVLANMGDTDYIAYSLRDYASGSYNSYTDHYVLFYDLKIENDALVSGSYPCMDIYRDGSYGYICNETTKTLSSVPFPAYGSFGTLSDLRKGVSHDETWTFLFAVGFAVVYCVCSRLFNVVQQLRGSVR